MYNFGLFNDSSEHAVRIKWDMKPRIFYFFVLRESLFYGAIFTTVDFMYFLLVSGELIGQ